MGEKKNKPEGGRKALYRKYRSKSLDDVVGQEHITKTLASAIKQDKVSHAYLFTGPRGVGKTSVARILAHKVNKLPYQNEGNHLDIIEIDAASNRRIDDIRDLRDKVHIAPVSAKYKVYIIDEVHMLTSESFNALLKTLEEPPSHVIFILATTEAHKLPATIISRTQRHSFKSIASADIVKHLDNIATTEKIAIEDEALQLIADHGRGSFRDSISLLDQMSGSDEKITRQLVEHLLGIAPHAQLDSLLSAVTLGKNKDILNIIESLVEYGVPPQGIAIQLAQLLKDMLWKDNKPDSNLVSLLGDLLSISGATYPKLQLEATLLKAASLNNPEQPLHHNKTTTPTSVQTLPKVTAPAKIQKSVVIPKPTSGKAKAASKTPSTPKESSDKSPPPDISIEAIWPDILAEIKKRNNPLYTILRLAKPQLQDDTLTLALGFEFHRKRIDDSKHRLVIAEVFEAITGQRIEVSAIIDKTLSATSPSIEPSPPTPEQTASASLVANIQDIMGGGEIINAE